MCGVLFLLRLCLCHQANSSRVKYCSGLSGRWPSNSSLLSFCTVNGGNKYSHVEAK